MTSVVKKSFNIYRYQTKSALWLFLCLFILSSFQLLAQKAPGKLTGKITDASTNIPLAGASVQVKAGKTGTSSASDGTYLLILPEGIYTIIYSSSGYVTKEISGVEIKAGENTFQDIILTYSTSELKGIVITSARKESQASVYSIQRRSSAASDGISIETILKTPDNNAGQITRRITGVSVQENRFVVVRGLAEQYNQTILNGVPMASTETDRNAFSMDLIPSAVIDNIVVNKTATPDMPGNFAGGLVQVNTLDFPASRFLSVSLQASAFEKTLGEEFYADQRGNLEILSFPGKIRDLPDGFPAYRDQSSLVQMNIQEKSRYLKMLKNNLTPISYGSSYPNYNVQIGFGNSYKLKNGSQFGVVLALNQRKSEIIEQEITARLPVGPGVGGVGDFTFLNYYSENVRYGRESSLGGALNLAYRKGNNKITFKNLYSHIFRNTHISRPYASIESFAVLNPVPGISRIAGTSHIAEERGILSNVLAGEHRTGRNSETRIDWNVNTALYLTEMPDTRNFIYKSVDSSGYLLGNNNSSTAQAISSQGRTWSDNKDFIYGGAFNVTTVFNAWGKKQLFKNGILFQNRLRNANSLLIPYYAPEGIIDSFLATSNVYPGGPLDFTTSQASAASQVGNYNAGSSSLAAFESMENNIGKKLKIIWGLRVENYHQYVNVFNPLYYDGFDEPVLQPLAYTSRNSFNFLPSINVIYQVSGKMNARLGYSSTVIRPELKDLAPFISFDFKNFQITQGNPDLRSTTIRNYDLKLEYFPSSSEILSVALYYKDLTDPIEKVAGTDNDIAIRPLNTGKAYVRGIEGEIRKRLNFISEAEWLGNILVFGNASWIESKVREGVVNNISIRQITEHTLSGQPDYIINAGISVQAFKKTFEATFSFNTTSDFINQLGTFNETTLSNGKSSPTNPHYNVKGRDMADIVITQTFLKNNAKIKFSISNLFNAPYILYQDLDGDGKFGTPVTIDKDALDYRIAGGTDNTPSSIIPQRNYSLTFSYIFK
jgi:hypothetical protein